MRIHGGRAGALVHAWLVLDFFGDARRSGAASSTLTTTIFTQSFLALAFAALLYPETPPVPFAAANLSLSSLLVAIGMLDHQDAKGRRLADDLLLRTAPLGASTVLMARGAHAAFYVALVTIGMALPPAVLSGFLAGAWTSAAGYVVMACICSGLACGALAVLVRALELVFGHARAALFAGSAKAMLLGSGVVLFALSLRTLRGKADDLPIGRIGAELLPTYHAARVLADPLHEAWRLGVLAAAGVVILLLLSALVGREREPGRRRSAVRPGLARALLRALAARGPSHGIADFVAVSMWRTASFRARVLPLLGLPAAMVVLSLPGTEQRHAYLFLCFLLQLPAIYLPFLIAFLPRAEDAEARWLFEQAPPVSAAVVRDATWRALVTHVLVPVHVVALLLMLLGSLSLAGFSIARFDLGVVAASVFSFAAAVVASRAMVRGVTRIPFTAEGDAETTVDLGSLFAFAVVLGGLGTAFGALSPGWRWPAAGAAALAAAVCLLRRPAGQGGLVSLAMPSQSPGVTEADAPAADAASGARASESLGRELKAIAVLYAAVCVLPALVGTLFAN